MKKAAAPAAKRPTNIKLSINTPKNKNETSGMRGMSPARGRKLGVEGMKKMPKMKKV